MQWSNAIQPQPQQDFSASISIEVAESGSVAVWQCGTWDLGPGCQSLGVSPRTHRTSSQTKPTTLSLAVWQQLLSCLGGTSWNVPGFIDQNISCYFKSKNM